MGIEKRLRELEIKRVLIADDLVENLRAAKEYVSGLGIKAGFAGSGKEAKEMIEKAYESGEKYDLVLSDLEMEEEESGLEVLEEGYRSLAIGFIVTGRNYDRTDHHGPYTRIEPGLGSVMGKKEKPEVWEAILGKVTEYLAGEGRPLLASLRRYDEYVGRPLVDTSLLMMQVKGAVRRG